MAVRIGKKGRSPRGAIMAMLAGGAAAAAVMLTPVPLIEMASAASGLPAILPTAAPPLGEQARLILAFGAGTGAMLLALLLNGLVARIERRRHSIIRIGYEIGYGEEEPDYDIETPAPRRPIFASSDLDGLAPLAGEGPRLPAAPEPLDETVLELDTPAPRSPLVAKPAARATPPHRDTPVEDPAGILEAAFEKSATGLATLSITELVDRFERGIERRRARRAAIREDERAEPAEPVEASAQPAAQPAWLEPARIEPATPEPAAARKSIDADVDEALRAALGTLQRMTARAA